MNQNRKKLYQTPKKDQNISCPDLCVDSTCPYDCYGYSDFYPIPQPLLPPPEPEPTAYSSAGGQTISTLLIIIITVLVSGFLIISYYVLVVKFLKRWNPFTPRRRQPPAMNEEFLDENRGPEIDHPIWYINTIGLQSSVINAITVFRYEKGDNLIEGTECAICLNEFLNEETLRLLPKCDHAFHIPCIDTWLRSHTNCPVCRAGIVSANYRSVSNGVNSIIFPPDEDSDQSGNSENGELNHSDEVIRDDGLCENRADSNQETEIQVFDNSMIEDEKNEIFLSVKRCASVDSFMAADISRAVDDGLAMAENGEVLVNSSQEIKEQKGFRGEQRINNGGSSSITEFLRKKPVRMKRSFSYAGRSFLPRQQHPRKDYSMPHL